MGKALILESLGSGNYKIQYTFETVIVDQRILELEVTIENLVTVEIPAQEALTAAAETSVADAIHNLNIAIGLEIEDEIRDKGAALIQARKYLSDQKSELSLLNITKTSLEATLEFLIKYRLKPVELKAWCVDYNEKISGEVGTIEPVSSTTDPVIIRPAGIKGKDAKYEEASDGIVASPASMSAFGWLFNTMMKPGHQKWFSKYRVATLMAFHTDDGNICNVRFDEALSEDLELDVNQTETSYNLPIEYLECNAEAFKLGDRVIVEHEEELPTGENTRGFFVPKRVIGFESHPRPCGLTFIVWKGDDTIDYNREYYLLRRGELQIREDLDNWEIIDDGKYSIIWDGVSHEDPDNYGYRTIPDEGDGLRVPETDTGRDAKKQEGTTVRFMTNQTLEQELWTAYEIDAGFIYKFLGADDSLTRAPYQMDTRASVCRYTTKGSSYQDFGILTFNRLLEANGGILLTKAWHTNSFGSAIPIINRGYVKRFDSSREYVDLAADEPEASALCCAVGETTDYRGIEYLIRGEAFKIGNAKLAEPLTEQKYNFRDKTDSGWGFISDVKNFYRSWDESTNDVYMIDANTIYGKVVNSETGFTITSGEQYINNDITLPYGITEDKKLTYVRKRKDTEFTMHNVGLYSAGQLVEESDFQDVITLWGDDSEAGKPAEYNAPILIRQTDCRPLQVHHKNFDIVVYRRVIYQDHETELLPYKTLRVISASYYFHAQVRRTIIKSEIQYAISVNGKITNLPYTTTVRESRLSVLSEEYVGSPLPLLTGLALGPWMDIGFDKDGVPTAEDNTQLTRIFISESGGNAFVGFDTFPASCKHNIEVTNDIIHPEFDDSVLSFPPYIDLEYIKPKGRKWLVFDSSGSVVEDITPPDDNRINGVCMLDPRG